MIRLARRLARRFARWRWRYWDDAAGWALFATVIATQRGDGDKAREFRDSAAYALRRRNYWRRRAGMEEI